MFEHKLKVYYQNIRQVRRKQSIINHQLSIINHQNGQTILEVIIALAMIILFLSGVVVVQLVAIRNVEYARLKSNASQLSRQQIERARVIRDTQGIGGLSVCLSRCYINGALTPIPITPTGFFGQSIALSPASSFDCPLPEITVTPAPVSYLVKSRTTWGLIQSGITPAPQVEISSCITDWR